MIFMMIMMANDMGDRWGLSFPHLSLKIEEKPRKSSTRKTDPTRDRIQTNLGVHSASYKMSIGGFPRG